MDVRKLAYAGATAFTAALLISFTAASAHAQPLAHPVIVTAHGTVSTRLVSYRDLALATNSGRETLMHRVRAAIGDVCPAYDATFNRYDVAGCQNFAWGHARPQIDSAFAAAASGLPLAMSIEITGATR